ncbi:MAG: hypothetical protein HRT58_10945 [Crocinitomicaceae bacterium]|nr:hypothetical protein [Flavobacteriales bacterium]NQZ36172.1 hypothetical protein [Crocinitomicaceae bacterium]
MDKIIQKIEKLCIDSYGLANSLRQDNYNPNHLVLDHFGRIVSTLVSIKTMYYSIDDSTRTNDGAKKYINECLPETFPKNISTAQIYLRETHTTLRFVLFQSYYSQVESTLRIIHRKVASDSDPKNPFTFLLKKYNLFDSEFIKFIKYARNTIHNNGFHFPDYEKDKVEFAYDFNGKKHFFSDGQKYEDMTIDDIFEMIDFMNKSIYEFFKANKELATFDKPD